MGSTEEILKMSNSEFKFSAIRRQRSLEQVVCWLLPLLRSAVSPAAAEVAGGEGRGGNTEENTPFHTPPHCTVGFLFYTVEHMWHFDVWLQFHQEEILWQSRRTNIHRRQWITQSGSRLILRSVHNFDFKSNLTRNHLPQPRNLICVWNLCFWRAAVFGDLSTCCWMFRF